MPSASAFDTSMSIPPTVSTISIKRVEIHSCVSVYLDTEIILNTLFKILTATMPVSAVEPVALVKLRHVNVHITHKGGHCNSLVLGVYGNYHHNISISTALLFCITDILANEQNVCYVLAGYLGGLLL